MLSFRNSSNHPISIKIKANEKVEELVIDKLGDKKIKIPYYPILNVEISKEGGERIWSGYIPFSNSPIHFNGYNLSVGNLTPPSLLNYSPPTKKGGRWLWLILFIVILVLLFLFLRKR